jgi:hypothetical protein
MQELVEIEAAISWPSLSVKPDAVHFALLSTAWGSGEMARSTSRFDEFAGVREPAANQLERGRRISRGETRGDLPSPIA